MSAEVLNTYLNDHLAGSVAAVELVDHLREASRGTEREQLFESLRKGIEQDQKVLRELLRATGGTESKIRKTAAWLTAKLGEIKLRLDDPGNGELHLLEALETLGLGIQGKLALWQALEAARDHKPELRALDFAALKRRALQQHGQVDAERLRVAGRVLGG